MPNQTNVVRYDSPLIRKRWLHDALLKETSKSFWTPFTGLTSESIIYQRVDYRQGDGHIVTFDYSGFLAGKGHRGFEKAFGNSESKKKFSNSLIVEYGRYSVDNGTKFNAEEIDALDLRTHEDSKTKLADLWIRNKDQSIFDTLQGFLRNEAPTHRIDLTSITYNDILEIENAIKVGEGYTVGDKRMPLKMVNGKYLFLIDSYTALKLKSDDKFQRLLASGGPRGSTNTLFSGVLVDIGCLRIIEAPLFFGDSSSNLLYKTSVETQGLRTLDENKNFYGTEEFTTRKYSRCLILGKGAGQLGMGQAPDYKFQRSTDFEIKSESAIELVFNVQKTKLVPENSDYRDGKVSGTSFGVIAVDIDLD